MFADLALSKYGAERFYNKYARMEKDEDGLQIGPDPQLTDLGRQQAARVAASWKSEAKVGMPQLESVYVSPLRRAGETCEISIADVLPDKRPLVVEHLREGINTMHEKEHNLPFDHAFEISPGLCFTDNARSSKSKIASLFPRFDFEDGFAEEDPMWTRTRNENGEQHIARTKSVFDRIFAHDKSTCAWHRIVDRNARRRRHLRSRRHPADDSRYVRTAQESAADLRCVAAADWTPS